MCAWVRNTPVGFLPPFSSWTCAAMSGVASNRYDSPVAVFRTPTHETRSNFPEVREPRVLRDAEHDQLPLRLLLCHEDGDRGKEHVAVLPQARGTGPAVR
jgi:hypothetical protein